MHILHILSLNLIGLRTSYNPGPRVSLQVVVFGFDKQKQVIFRVFTWLNALSPLSIRS